jgi:Ohr subfamily peroxiredoxin
MNTQSLYTTEVSIKGGSNAHLSSADRAIDLDLRLPEELGGPGGATNAEQLFAAAFAACLSSALSAAAAEGPLKMPTSPEITSVVELARADTGAYHMAVRLSVRLPDLPADQAQQLVTRARQIWPWHGPEAVTLTIET